ncbi:PRC-barrel domain-containing protein [Ruegeria marina]|uniref:PRC-barrel domain-containing protein n=1 Tax=Ruegeria marina TaxID=639004 RepID=A0A1G6UZA4_9RHOB|nr:PRC-barrel domain-containing protein [Ruegeria marina]SDD46603.1 hypothetical protein SAMN04488239_107195 [Ruegeria marina]
MLLSYNDLRRFAIEAADGRKGHAEDFYLDDESWRVRYLVTETGFLFTRQQGLVKSTLLGTPDVERRTVPIALNKKQLDEAQSPDKHPPVSVQQEHAVRHRQFELWPALMLGVPGAAYTPARAEHQLFGGPEAERNLGDAPQNPEDPHLRSMAEMMGYAVRARDGQIGSIVDFLLDPDGWKIRYIAADTGTWLPGRQVVIRTDWISAVSWADQSIAVDDTKETVEQSPELTQIEDLERSDAHLAFTPYGAYGAHPM